MRKLISSLASILIVCLSMACSKEDIKDEIDTSNFPDTTAFKENIRVPAEWETHEATWMQWALDWEKTMRPAFADIVGIVKQYESVHLIVTSESEKTEAIEFLAKEGVNQDNITWHMHELDNSWMRDSGPIYLTDGKTSWIQNWKFNGWGSGFGVTPWENDNKVPLLVADYLNIEVENRQDYVLEKGNIEVNGDGILLINWDCQKERNPNIPQEYQEALLKNALGVSKIIWAYGHYDGDGTIGHIDGTARFIDENTVVIADWGSDLENNLAADCRKEGLEVIMYEGDMNWLVGNGFVVVMGDGSSRDEQAKVEMQKFWPKHDIHVIDGSKMAELGGGIHCVTNDQPVILQ